MPSHGSAFDFLTAEGPSIFGTVGSLLYVGHRGDTHPWWHETFAKSLGITRIAVIDIDKGNLHTAAHVTSELYHGDIRQTDCPKDFDLIFWDEGPEHLPREQSLELIKVFNEHGSRVLISCPWGFQLQGTDPNDPEFHHWGPMPEDFESIGMTARTFGVMFSEGSGHGNLIAWT